MTYTYTVKHDNSEHPFNEFKLTAKAFSFPLV